MDDLLELLSDMLGTYHKNNVNKGQVNFNCPNCDDDNGKGKLEINYYKNKYSCWSCWQTENGVYGKNIKYLFFRYGSSDLIRNFFNLDLSELSDDNYHVQYKFKMPDEYQTFDLLSKKNKALKYLITDRKISLDLVNKFGIGFATEGLYSNRVIVPSFNIKGKINYCVCRDYTKSKKLKYLNPDKPKSDFIFNELFLDWNTSIFLVEGVFDHLILPNSIPLLGKSLPNFILNKLKKNAMSNIYIFIDGDAKKNIVKLYKKLNFGVLANRIFIVNVLDDDDVNSLYCKLGVKKLYEYIKNNNYKLKKWQTMNMGV